MKYLAICRDPRLTTKPQMILGTTNIKLWTIMSIITLFLERPTMRMTPRSKLLLSTLNMSSEYTSSTEIEQRSSMTRLKMSCRKVTEISSSLKSYRMNASMLIGKYPRESSANDMCPITDSIT